MSVEIQPATLADSDALAVNNITAFSTDTTWMLGWDVSVAQIVEACKKRMPVNLLTDRPVRRQVKAVEPGTGRLLGYARWVLPDSRRGQWLDYQVAGVTPAEESRLNDLWKSADWRPNVNGVGVLDQPFRGIRARLQQGREYITLEYLAVHPDNRRRGVASALVADGIRHAEAMGVDIFVTAFKAGRSVYLRAGFRELESLIQDDRPWGGQGEYGTYFMVYEVGKKGEGPGTVGGGAAAA